MNISIKILFITHYPSMYGANKSLLQLILELRENYNITPTVLLRSKGEICELLDNNNIEYIISHFYWWVYQGKGIKNKLLNYIKQIRNIKKINKIYNLVKTEKFDLIYTNSITISIGLNLSKKLKCSHIWHLRETLEQFNFNYSLGNYFSNKLMQNNTNVFIAISKFVKRRFEKQIKKKEIRIIYNGIKINKNYTKSNSYNNIFNICIVGIVSKQKNQFDAVKAINEIVNNRNIKNIKLTIIGGKKESYYNQISQYINDNSLNNYIEYLGHQNNIDKILEKMNIGLMCSENEAFGRVTIEYMLSRLPVIASNSGANEEIVINNKNGFIYSLNNTTELADRIEFFINNKDQLDVMGAFAQQYAIENFSSKKNTEQIYRVIKEVLNK